MLESQSFKIPPGSSFWDLYEARFEAGNGSRIDTALHSIEEANTKLKGVFQDISFNTDKLGDEKQRTTFSATCWKTLVNQPLTCAQAVSVRWM